MAIECMAEVINARRAPWKGGDYLVLLMLASYADPDGTNIYPRVATLARAARMKERNAQICLRALLDDGVLEKVKESRGQRFNEYRINMERVQSLQGCKVCRGAKCGDEGCNPMREGVQNPVSHIETRPRPDLKPSSARAAGAVDRTGVALSVWQTLEAKLPAAKLSRLASFKPEIVETGGALAFDFPTVVGQRYSLEIQPLVERALDQSVLWRYTQKVGAPSKARKAAA